MVLEQRDCVESPVDYVCGWNWYGQNSLIYIRVLACSLY